MDNVSKSKSSRIIWGNAKPNWKVSDIIKKSRKKDTQRQTANEIRKIAWKRNRV